MGQVNITTQEKRLDAPGHETYEVVVELVKADNRIRFCFGRYPSTVEKNMMVIGNQSGGIARLVPPVEAGS